MKELADMVVRMIGEISPALAVAIVSPSELLVAGKRVNLENLDRMVRSSRDSRDQVVRRYVDALFGSEACEIDRLLLSADLDEVRSSLMPRIQSESIFRHLDRGEVAHVPFVNDCVVTVVLDKPTCNVSCTNSQMARWGITPEEAIDIARENLELTMKEVEITMVQSQEGGLAAIISVKDGYDAARLLLPSLHRVLHRSLGHNFYVAIPARDQMVAMSTTPQAMVERIRGKIIEDHRRMPYPITDDLFYVTMDGVVGTKGWSKEWKTGEAA